MHTADTCRSLARMFSEVVDGVTATGGGFMLNSGDIGLLRSLDALSADDASQSANGGATIAAHAQHLRYGLSLMNEWATNGGNPFANAKWDEAWTISRVKGAQWAEIRAGLRTEAARWLTVLETPRDVSDLEYSGLISSIAHLAYHFGAIRQINRTARGPTSGSFSS